MKTSFFILFLILLFGGVASAQSNAIVVFDERTNMRSVELLNSPNKISDCKADKANGIITDVEFDIESKITGLRLKSKYRKRVLILYFWFPEEAYLRLKEKESTKLTSLIKKSNRVSISFYTCGSKAQADFVDSIFRL